MVITSATYSGYYKLTGFNPADGSWFGATQTSSSTTLQDDDSNGTAAQGDAIWNNTWSYYESYTGWSYGGRPITTDGTDYFLYTSTWDVPSAGSATSSSYTFCFARGTLISTPQGAVAVETLQIGDQVITADGVGVDVRWIGRQTINPLFARLNGSLPIRIAAGALGEGLPVRDLLVSPDHALLVDGVLVHASALVNDATIEQVSSWGRENVEYFHIELENHDLVLAEGAAAETFVDNASRKQFDNWQEYVELYGDESFVSELDLPRVKYRRQLSTRTRNRLMYIASQAVGKIA